MLPSKYQWVKKQAGQDEAAQRLASALNLSPMTAYLLILRGADTPDRADLFLHPEKTKFYDPNRMLGMQAAVQRITQAITGDQRIRIFGDYDADGVTSTALVIRALRQAGAEVSHYIPNRFKDGYGPNTGAVETAAADGVQLILTVDCGIAALPPAKRAKELGIDYIITDHHEPPADLPDAFAILNPKQPGCDYPFRDLCGAGVALKLLQALFPEDEWDPHWIDLAAIGTIADLVMLRDENRLIASTGLRQISSGSYSGIQALKLQSGSGETVDSDRIGFQMAPRLNAAGRLEDAEPALKLLLSDDPDESRLLAEELDALNQKRKSLVDTIAKEADLEAKSYIARGDRALVLAGKGWNQGVIGIAASKMVEKYHRPTLILSIDEASGTAKGSGRSIRAFNLYQGLSQCSEHLIQFGGHQMAAGLSLESASIEPLREAFDRVAAEVLTDKPLTPEIEVAAECTPEQVTVEQIDELAKLAPFGMGNPRPVFELERVPLTKMSVVGREQAHLKIVLKGSESDLDGIGFGLGPLAKKIASGDRLNLLGELSINEWNGFRRPQLMLKDLRVDDLQVFDWRSEMRLREKIGELADESVDYLAFQAETRARLNLNLEVTSYQAGLTIHAPALVLLDLPDEAGQLAALLANSPSVHRIYAVFSHVRDHFFSAFPTRENFIWLFSLIHKQHSFTLRPMAEQIARHKGWSKQMVNFMIQVFFELGFVRIEEGLLTEVKVPKKAPLSASMTYQKEKNQIKLEDLFCYAPITSLKDWFNVQKKRRGQEALPEGNSNEL
ncbi:MAG: single-stranded-DNA-specific exonuclease RecJ [Sporolactobacillus sp.]